MLSWINQSKVIYILSNLLVLPATFVPFIDLISNISFIVSILLLAKTNIILSLVLCILIIVKNNSNYRFNLLIKIKGEEISKSDYECVYLYAWCTLLRYLLIALAANQIFLFFK
tara:strand:+ start:363 stop:704 length:342 start_codon:yes stop_codon:yes gene_type:complete